MINNSIIVQAALSSLGMGTCCKLPGWKIMQKMLDYFPGCVCQLALRLPHRDKGQKNETSRKACIAMFLSTEAEIEDHRISKMPLGRCNDAWSDYGDRSQLGKSLKGEHQKRNTAPPKKHQNQWLLHLLPSVKLGVLGLWMPAFPLAGRVSAMLTAVSRPPLILCSNSI